MRAAIYFADGYEEIEALAVVDVLRRGEVEVVMTGVTGSSVKSARGIEIKMDTVIGELDHQNVDMIILPGGIPGVYNLEKDNDVVRYVKTFKEQGKWIAAICAAPGMLGRLDLLINEKATCYPGNEKYLEGCEYVDQSTVVSGKLITSKGVGTALEFALMLLEVAKGKEVSDCVKKAMLL